MTSDARPKVRRKIPVGLGDVFQPNRTVSRPVMQTLIVIQVLLFIFFWINSPLEVLPKPGEVGQAFRRLWFEQGLGQELIRSFKTNFQAIVLTGAIGLVLSYLTVMPFFRPIVNAVSKGRFLSLVGFTFVFTMIVGGGQQLKLSLLVFGMTVFFLTSMAAVVADIPKEQFDHARTLRMGEWKAVWEVVIRGTMDKAFEVMRQNAAIGWMMLTLVEGNQRGLGGVGAMLLNEQKHLKLPEVFAIQLTILGVGLFQDYAIGVVRKLCCPYADLTLERR